MSAKELNRLLVALLISSCQEIVVSCGVSVIFSCGVSIVSCPLYCFPVSFYRLFYCCLSLDRLSKYAGSNHPRWSVSYSIWSGGNSQNWQGCSMIPASALAILLSLCSIRAGELVYFLPLGAMVLRVHSETW